MTSRFSAGTIQLLGHVSFSFFSLGAKTTKKGSTVVSSTTTTATPLTTTTTTTTGDQDICLTPYCVKAADYLIESIDETVEPCEDFFNFVCGTWIKNTRIPDDAGAQNTFNLLRAQLDSNIVDILSSPPANDTNEPMAVVNARLLYKSCIDEAGIEADGQGDLGLGTRDYYNSETNITVAYRRFIRDLATALANNPSWIDNDVKDIFEFEKTISEYHWTSAEQRARDNETVRTTIGDLALTLNTTSFNFTDYLHQAYLLGNVTLVDDDIIFVRELEYLLDVSAIVSQTPPRTLQNYMIWRFVMNRVSNMPQQFRIFRDRFERVLRGTSAESPRTILCGGYVNNNMGFAVSKLYIKRYFDANARNQSFDMIDNIQAAFIDMLHQTTWMDAESMTKAIEKAKAIDRRIGYPDYLSSDNNTKLDEDYAEVPTNIDSGIGVVIGHEITHGFDDMGRQFDKDGNRIPWWSDATIQNFINRKTCIVEQYSNYTITQIGMKANGFQTQGEDIADNGGLREAFFAYQKWAKENPNLDKRLPGLQKYTPEQMYFINYAHTWCTKMTNEYALSRLRTDEHSLGQLRVIGPTSNFNEFDRAFGCTPGQGNSRKNKCIVW
ncbi:unnamed protein product [Rotaria sordida]|uniref:Neprilysin n=1 Tax=Rotaria sordida TaxID=392033 RepID=A0A818QEL3_9BILA|nr:unnamed protein product [Rotaria sordida]